ncbi:hypothetical protein GOBAR_DD21559 [Gossypium barbadense]|nr:hypothetical protein GOBAR_DD21559 [Gossypium barbadense]
MGNLELRNKPHAICIPFLAQGHINPVLKLAKLLQHNDVPSLCDSISKTCLPHFNKLVHKLNTDSDVPTFSCIVSDGARSFTLDAAQEFGVPQDLEHQVLRVPSSKLPPVYSLGPLNLLLNHQPNSVVYVNFGVISVMTPEQLTEFACGLANMASWCPQEQVLSHPSLVGFLTHSGWNSTIESISFGVPMIWWPFFADQQTNCWFSCTRWGIAMEINSDVKRDEVAGHVRELMEGEKGKAMKKKALEWKKMAEEATNTPDGSSYDNLNHIINQGLLH